MLTSYLRPSNIDASKNSRALLKLQVKRLRKTWPEEDSPHGTSREIYDKIYCARGEMENRIKEQQPGLFADRTSCRKFDANQFRLHLSSLAYILLETLRRTAICGTEPEKAQVTTIRNKLLKIGAIAIPGVRRIVLQLSSAYPLQELFMRIAGK